MSAPLVELRGVSKHYSLPREHLWQAPPTVQALTDVSLALEPGQSLGLVGESGSGKSTLARLVMALEAPSTGQVLLDGTDHASLGVQALRERRAHFQMVFQDPYGSLDPRMTVARIVAEPLVAQNTDPKTHAERVTQSLEAVGLAATDAAKYPHEFSGGQRQRIAIARALITRPKLIVADEPVSALDVSVQAQVLNLMMDLADEFGITYLFISHDLAVVRHICPQVAVLQAGRIVEIGPTQQVFDFAQHAYTRALLASAA